ncbi:complement C1q tumor necrosis factor-related protein 7-like [Mytilus edulis]|uniref:complement C1q tumor necrosis factor-related protein 7-like n=1 Tax=Mytilus edulis TaxID=6550 RepID=UPI0039F04013
MKSNFANRPKGSVVIYDEVITNDGNSYNPSTGIFTGPTEGLYSFSWTTTTQANKYFFTDLTVNGNMIARNYGGHDNVNLSASQTVVVHLKKNDKVNIKVQDNYVGQFIYGDGWSSFSGFMI